MQCQEGYSIIYAGSGRPSTSRWPQTMAKILHIPVICIAFAMAAMHSPDKKETMTTAYPIISDILGRISTLSGSSAAYLFYNEMDKTHYAINLVQVL